METDTDSRDLAAVITALHSQHADSRWLPFAEALADVVAAAAAVNDYLETLPVLVGGRAELSCSIERLRRVGVDLVMDRGLGGIPD